MLRTSSRHPRSLLALWLLTGCPSSPDTTHTGTPHTDSDTDTASDTGDTQTLPLAPSSLAAAPGDGVVTLSWGAVSGASSYTVFWSTGGAVDETSATLPSTSTTTTAHTGLTNGTTYSYRVAAENGAGRGPLSAQVDATPMTSSGLRLIAAGAHSSFLVDADGDLYAWGRNDIGQLGLGNFSATYVPTQVQGISDVVAVSSGGWHTLAITADGALYGWGQNDTGQVGLGNTSGVWRPTRIGLRNDWVSVAAGRLHSVGATADGGVWVWGNNTGAHLGLPQPAGHVDQPEYLTSGVLTGTDPGVVWAGDATSFFKPDTDGKEYLPVASWGLNSGGQLGRDDGGDIDLGNTPAPIASSAKYLAMSTRAMHTLALREDRTMVAWGVGVDGQLGNGGTSNAFGPVPVQFEGHVVAIAAGTLHSLALGDDGKVLAWGSNGFGQLGDGSYDSSPIRVWVQDLDSVEAIAAGESFGLALKRDGTLWAWGSGSYGQLGTGTPVGSNVPVQVAWP
ncbi:MAG: fibronectin type III domain-containing protein [Alphaproteobacteria bacterium]|nr:fibronectin type III domain-containing protein [Alphaproteobacteria bacterium]MCB9695664.1 fibronectin type III domain-containing protein [Alphaproteobacteria bacterium]